VRIQESSLVIVAAVVGLFMSFYVPWIHYLTKINQHNALEIARKIEIDFSFPYKLNSEIHQKYRKWKPGYKSIWVLTLVFVLAWLAVICTARRCLATPSERSNPEVPFAPIH
jgi:hypothetical protein